MASFYLLLVSLHVLSLFMMATIWYLDNLKVEFKSLLNTNILVTNNYMNNSTYNITYPPCLKDHIEKLNNNNYLYSNYKKLFFTLPIHHNISIKFFIYTPKNPTINQCVAIYYEERFQFLSNHPNRVYNISQADVIIMNISTTLVWAYPCKGKTHHIHSRWIQKKYLSQHSDPQYIWIPKNNSKNWCLSDRPHNHTKNIYNWFNAFYHTFVKLYSDKPIFLFTNAHKENSYTKRKTHLIRGAIQFDKGNFRNHLDISLPPPLRNFMAFGEHRNNLTQYGNDCKRKYFATFKGSLISYLKQLPFKFKFNRQWRKLLKYWHNSADGMIIKGTKEKGKQYDYSDLMLNSYLNFAPRGTNVFSYRFREILYCGRAVAILLANNYILPFNNVIDWDYYIEQHSLVVIDEKIFENYTNNLSLGNTRGSKRLFQELFLEDFDTWDMCRIQQNLKELQLYFNGIAAEMQTLLLAIQERVYLFGKIRQRKRQFYTIMKTNEQQSILRSMNATERKLYAKKQKNLYVYREL